MSGAGAPSAATGRLVVAMERTGFILGVRGIDIVVDGAVAGTLGFGETREIACVPGDRIVQLALRAVIGRRSNRLPVVVAADSPVTLRGRYSRLWGTLRLRTA